MLRFLPGVVLLQVVTLVLVWVQREQPLEQLLLVAGLPAALLALVTALWFASIGRALSERLRARQDLAHAREREQWQHKAARSEKKLLADAQKNLERQQRRVHRGANLKVGMAFTMAAGAGVLLMLTPLVTMGLLTLTTASGALGGYLLRGRRENRRLSGDVGGDVGADEGGNGGRDVAHLPEPIDGVTRLPPSGSVSSALSGTRDGVVIEAGGAPSSGQRASRAREPAR